jgi:hypothetical protein
LPDFLQKKPEQNLMLRLHSKKILMATMRNTNIC